MEELNHQEELCRQIRRDIIRMVYEVQSGHPGGSLGCVEFFISLYQDIMTHHPNNFSIDGIGEDLFFLSNGHISPVWYATLARNGYFPLEELKTFRKLNSRLQGHPTTHDHLPGIRIASGSLGQGLSVAIGAANAKKLNHDNKRVFSLHGDGELQEGQIWEAALYAGAKKVDNLIATVDCNGQQIDGSTDEILKLSDLRAKFEAFDWIVLEEKNGNNLTSVKTILKKAKDLSGKGKPIIILLKTNMGCGIDFMEGTNAWHGKAPNQEQYELAISQLRETHLGDYFV